MAEENSRSETAARDLALVAHGVRLARLNALLEVCKEEGGDLPAHVAEELGETLCEAHDLGVLVGDAEAARDALGRRDLAGVMGHVYFAHNGRRVIAPRPKKLDA